MGGVENLSYQLSAISYQLSAISYQLSETRRARRFAPGFLRGLRALPGQAGGRQRRMVLRIRTVQNKYDASPPTTGGVALSNRPGRSGTTIHGWPAVFAGTVVTAAGIALAAAAMEIVAPGAVKTHGMPRWILALVGLLFAF